MLPASAGAATPTLPNYSSLTNIATAFPTISAIPRLSSTPGIGGVTSCLTDIGAVFPDLTAVNTSSVPTAIPTLPSACDFSQLGKLFPYTLPTLPNFLDGNAGGGSTSYNVSPVSLPSGTVYAVPNPPGIAGSGGSTDGSGANGGLANTGPGNVDRLMVLATLMLAAGAGAIASARRRGLTFATAAPRALRAVRPSAALPATFGQPRRSRPAYAARPSAAARTGRPVAFDRVAQLPSNDEKA